MYELEIIIFISLLILFLLVFFNSYRIHKYIKNHKTTTIHFDNAFDQKDTEIIDIMNNVRNEDDSIKSQIQDNLTKLNDIDSKLSEHESAHGPMFETIDENTENILQQQFETGLNNSFNNDPTNSRISQDVRSHFLYTDVSEENSLNIKKIENEILTLTDKIQSLQNNLNSIQFISE